MVPELILIAGNSVDWARFVAHVNVALGRSPTREQDNCGLTVGGPASYVASLAEFARRGSNPLTALRDNDRLLEHPSFTFLACLDAPTALAVLKQSHGLHVLSAEPTKGRENFIISGTLRAWRDAVIEGCAADGNEEARTFYNKVWDAFDRLGFREVFGKYNRVEQPDLTFALRRK